MTIAKKKGAGQSTRNNLTGAQKFRLCKWYDEKRPTGTDEEVAKQATQALQMPVTEGNILGCRDLFGIKKKTWTKSAETPFRALEKRVELIEEFMRKELGWN